MEVKSNRRQSGSKEDVDVSESKSDLDFRSVSGNNIFCTESRHSSANCLGNAPLRAKMISGWYFFYRITVTHSLIDSLTDMFGGPFFVNLKCSFKKAV